MPEPVTPNVIKKMQGWRQYFNFQTPKGRSNVIYQAFHLKLYLNNSKFLLKIFFGIVACTGLIGYSYYSINRKDRFITMKDSYKNNRTPFPLQEFPIEKNDD